MTMKRPCRYNTVHRCMLSGLALICLVSCEDSRLVRNAMQPMTDDVQPTLTDMISNAVEPGPEHERLQALIGDWKAERRAWPRPGAPVELGKGTLTNFRMLDGRFVGQEYKSRAQRPKYQGLGALGYDDIKKMYINVWLDTTSTSIYTATGSCDASGKVFTVEGVYQDPVTGKPVKRRSITRIINSKKYTFELFKEDSDGELFRTLEVIYTRK